MTDSEVLLSLEKQNSMRAQTITKITPLRRKRRDTSDIAKTVKLHHSIIVYMKDPSAANRCITNGFFVDWLHYAAERFTPQYQIMQCFNCLDYGHRATNCKRHSRCGKCENKHNTRECTHTGTPYCVQCKGSHEAWHPQCPASLAEKEQLEELMGRSHYLFS